MLEELYYWALWWMNFYNSKDQRLNEEGAWLLVSAIVSINLLTFYALGKLVAPNVVIDPIVNAFVIVATMGGALIIFHYYLYRNRDRIRARFDALTGRRRTWGMLSFWVYFVGSFVAYVIIEAHFGPYAH